jgi:hypothetical protein
VSGFVYGVRRDGTGLRKVITQPVIQLKGISPDGAWLAVWSPISVEEGTAATFAVPVAGGSPVRIYHEQRWRTDWSLDGRLLFLPWGGAGMQLGAGKTYVLPVPAGQVLPALPAAGFQSEAEISAWPGVRVIESDDATPGPTPGVYAFSRQSVQRNLYRIPLPQ